MTKNRSVAADRNGADSSTGPWMPHVDRLADSSPVDTGARREILFPTERTSIPRRKIDQAVDAVLARKK